MIGLPCAWVKPRVKIVNTFETACRRGTSRGGRRRAGGRAVGGIPGAPAQRRAAAVCRRGAAAVCHSEASHEALWHLCGQSVLPATSPCIKSVLRVVRCEHIPVMKACSHAFRTDQSPHAAMASSQPWAALAGGRATPSAQSASLQCVRPARCCPVLPSFPCTTCRSALAVHSLRASHTKTVHTSQSG